MMRSILWCVAGFLFLGIDLMLPHMVLLFFGIGALAAALLSFFGLSLAIELATFSLVSIATLLLFRRTLTRIFSGTSVQKCRNAAKHPLLGRRGIVSRAIEPASLGEIRIDGSFWRASAETSLPEGTEVTVCGVSDENELCLIVRPCAKLND